MPEFKSPEFPKRVEDIAVRRQRESSERKKLTYWAIRKSDELIVKANDTLNRARSILMVAGQWHEKAKPKSDPFLAWGELLIQGIQNPKRRADD